MFTLHISVPTYLKKYLLQTYGNDYKVSYGDDLGILILNLLKNKSNAYYEFEPKLKNKESVYFDIKISMSFFDKYGCSFNHNDMELITRSIDKWFRNMLYRSAILNYSHFGVPYKNTISKYLSSFGIGEDELSYSTIRRDFNRKKAKIAEQLLIETV